MASFNINEFSTDFSRRTLCTNAGHQQMTPKIYMCAI